MAYRAAEEQCVRSSDLKPAGAKTAHLESSGDPPGDGEEVLAAQNTIEYAEEETEKKHRDFFGFDALEGDSEFVDPEDEAEDAWRGKQLAREPSAEDAMHPKPIQKAELSETTVDETETANVKFMNESEENITMKNNDEEPEEPIVAQGLKVAQETMASGLSTPLSCARMGWFKSAKCCGVGNSSPTCGRSAWNPNQLRSGVGTTICGAGCGVVNSNHKIRPDCP